MEKYGNVPNINIIVEPQARASLIKHLTPKNGFYPFGEQFIRMQGMDGKPIKIDAAQAAPGGIDLNTQNMKTNVTGDKVDIVFDRAMIESFKREDFTGVRPVILNVTPIQSVLPLLGLAPRREDELAMGS